MPLNILFLGRNMWGTKGWSFELFRDEIARQANVTFRGPGYDQPFATEQTPYVVKDLVDEIKPDVIMTEFRTWEHKLWHGLEDIDVLKAHKTNDYSTWDPGAYASYIKRYKFDVIFGQYGKDIELAKKVGIHIHFLPMSVCTSMLQPLNLQKRYDVMASYATKPEIPGFYPHRAEIRDALDEMDLVLFKDIRMRCAYVRKINQSRIFVNSADKTGATSKKFTESLACGTFFMTDQTYDLDRLGYRDGIHLSVFDGLNDFKERVMYYLDHPEARKHIAQQGMALVRNCHSDKVRVEQMLEVIENAL